jgi:hypothetical protein
MSRPSPPRAIAMLCPFSTSQLPVGSAPAIGDIAGMTSGSGAPPARTARTARTIAWCSQGARVLFDT